MKSKHHGNLVRLPILPFCSEILICDEEDLILDQMSDNKDHCKCDQRTYGKRRNIANGVLYNSLFSPRFCSYNSG